MANSKMHGLKDMRIWQIIGILMIYRAFLKGVAAVTITAIPSPVLIRGPVRAVGGSGREDVWRPKRTEHVAFLYVKTDGVSDGGSA